MVAKMACWALHFMSFVTLSRSYMVHAPNAHSVANAFPHQPKSWDDTVTAPVSRILLQKLLCRTSCVVTAVPLGTLEVINRTASCTAAQESSLPRLRMRARTRNEMTTPRTCTHLHANTLASHIIAPSTHPLLLATSTHHAGGCTGGGAVKEGPSESLTGATSRSAR